MISFSPTDEQTQMVEMMREFAQRELTPQARACDEDKSIPESLYAHAWELGIINGVIPEEFGGAGMDRSPVTNALIYEALGEGCASLASALLASTGFVNAILDFGNDAQKQGLLPGFCESEPKYASIALHDDDFQFDPYLLKTTATKTGNGWVLSGSKRFVSHADKASHFLVIAREGDNPGFSGIRAFVLPKDQAGLEIETENDNTLGLQAIPQSRLVLNECAVDDSALLGEGTDASTSLGADLINGIRIGNAALCVGLSKAVTEFAIPYAKEREAFGEPIAKKQAIAFMLADMFTEVESMRWLVWKAASLLEQKRGGARFDPMEVTKATTLAQDYVRKKTIKVADDGLQVFGGHGFIRDLPLELWYRNARALTVVEGLVAA